MRKSRITYIVQSSIGLGLWALLSAVVSVKVGSAVQLDVPTKIAIWGLLWGTIAFWTYKLVRDYKKLSDPNLDLDQRQSQRNSTTAPPG